MATRSTECRLRWRLRKIGPLLPAIARLRSAKGFAKMVRFRFAGHQPRASVLATGWASTPSHSFFSPEKCSETIEVSNFRWNDVQATPRRSIGQTCTTQLQRPGQAWHTAEQPALVLAPVSGIRGYRTRTSAQRTFDVPTRSQVTCIRQYAESTSPL